jgi:GNAT superfamily N-acetyltransferase
MSSKTDRLWIASESGAGTKPAELQIRIANRLKLGLYSKLVRYGLSRDLAVAFEKPSAKIPISVRRATDSDLRAVLAIGEKDTLADKLEITWRRAFVERGATGGFVAVDERNNAPCYVQWLFGAADNKFVQELGWFPLLKRGEALLENAYTPSQYRGLGIMSAAMAMIAEHAPEVGASEVMTFVDQQNIASLKGCQRAGFYPSMLHRRMTLAFGLLKWNEFEPFPKDDPRRAIRF